MGSVSARASKDGRPHCTSCTTRPRGKVTLLVTGVLMGGAEGDPPRIHGRCLKCKSRGLTQVTAIIRSVGWRVSHGLWTKIPVRP